MQNQNQNQTPDDCTDDANVAAWLAVSLLADADDADTYDGIAVDEAREHLEAASEAAPRGSAAAVRIGAAREDLAEAAETDRVGKRQVKVRDALAELAPVAVGVADHDHERRGADALADADDRPLLAAAVAAHEMLENADRDAASADQDSQWLNALEALDNLVMDASPGRLVAALDDVDARPWPEADKPAAPVFYDIPEAAADRAIARVRQRRENDSSTERRYALAEYVYEEIREKHLFFVGDVPLAEYASERGVDSLTIGGEPDD
jgi:hypothetical protein